MVVRWQIACRDEPWDKTPEPVANPTSIAEHLPLRVGQPFDRVLLASTRDTITRRLQDNGYPAAVVDLSFADSGYRGRAVYEVTPGTRAVLGEISVEITPRRAGESPKISASTARKLLGVKTGDSYRESNLERAKKNLYLTQAYSAVAVDVDSSDVTPPGDSVVRVRVSLTEDAMRSARMGAGYGTLDCFRIEGDFSHLNFSVERAALRRAATLVENRNRPAARRRRSTVL